VRLKSVVPSCNQVQNCRSESDEQSEPNPIRQTARNDGNEKGKVKVALDAASEVNAESEQQHVGQN
jgi:hypothetical protein